MTARLEAFGRRRCFSTLGCVELSFSEICELAAEFGVPGLELRGIGGRMDMPQYCAEQGLTTARTQEICRRCQTELVVAGSSVKLTTASDKERIATLARSDDSTPSRAMAALFDACV